MSRRAWLACLAGLVVLAALVRLPLLTRQGLWADELFSLAMATGHSLEHPAAEAEPEQGDFVEGSGARTTEEWRRYLSHDEPAASPARVLRAVLRSDTSPPLYYLLLWAWTRAFGTSDGALRGFSLACALLAFPFLARLAAWVAGRRAMLPACLFFALAPPAVYYGTEGRMYALLWLCVLASAWALARLPQERTPLAVAAFALTGAAGFLTHYFFAFVWSALVVVAFLRAGRAARFALAAGAGGTLLLIAPWYLRLGDSLTRWRITQDWLALEPTGFSWAGAASRTVLGSLSGSDPDLWGEQRSARAAALILFAVLAVAAVARRGRHPFASRRLVLWAWLAAAWSGPFLFDAWRHTYTGAVPRYSLAGLPALFLLAASACASLGARARAALVLAVCLAWTPHLRLMMQRASRSWSPLREVAHALERESTESSLILVHSIPSGVLGIARYYQGEAPLAAWVEQLGGRRVPESFLALARGKEQVVLVRAHEVGAPCPLEEWLRAEATLSFEGRRESILLRNVRPKGAPSF